MLSKEAKIKHLELLINTSMKSVVNGDLNASATALKAIAEHNALIELTRVDIKDMTKEELSFLIEHLEATVE